MKSARLFPSCIPFLAALALAATVAAQTTAPTTSVGSTSAVQTVTLTMSEAATVGSINVLTQGAPNLDFQLASGGTCAAGTVYTKGQTCTAKYTFNPTHPGIRYGAIVLYDNASPAKAAATKYLQGTGNGPQVIFQTQPWQNLGSGSYLTGTGFLHPNGVGVDGNGNIFVADTSDGTIREILAAGGYQTVQIVHNGLGAPEGLALDGGGNLFYSDSSASAVNEIVAASGYTQIRTVGNGFNNPNGLAVDGSGNVFVADTGNNAVKEILAAGGFTNVKTLGSGFGGPLGVVVDATDNVFVADTGNNAVKEILVAGGYTTVNTLATGFNEPVVALDRIGNLFVGFYRADCCSLPGISEFLAQGGYTTESPAYPFGTPGSEVVTDLAVDSSGNILLTTDSGSNNHVARLGWGDWPTVNFYKIYAGAGGQGYGVSREVLVANDGNQTLSITGFSYPVDFPQSSASATDCTSSTDLAANETCTLTPESLPLGSSLSGPTTVLNEDVTLTDNSLNVANATQDITVTGTVIYKPAYVTSPTPSTTLSSSIATFNWNSGGYATTFQFRLGTKLGSNDIYGSGPTSATSETVSNLPSTGVVHARLYYQILGAWKYADYVYYTPTALISPTPGTTLSGSTATFSWNAGASTTFKFVLGIVAGGNGIYGSGQTTRTSVTVNNLPTNGETIHARLYYLVGSTWQYHDYTYTAQ